MPPKKRAAKEKGKGGEAKKKTNRVPDEPEEQPSREEEEGAETQPEQPEQDHEPDAEDEDEDEDPALQRIVEFYEAHPYFYNLRHEKYRNTKLNEAELAELAKEIKWTVEKIKRRFKNLRSAYGKLKNRAGSAGKSGQASCRLTSRQEWKLRNLAFLDEVIQPRTQGQELGRVTGEDEDEDEDDDDVEAREDFVAPDNEDEDRGTEGRKRGSSADSQDSASKRNRNRNRAGTSTSTSISRKKKGAKSAPDVGEILTEMLLEYRRRDRETEKKLEESATRQPDEREAWGSWLQTVVRNCPKEKFRQFQTETLALSQRYQPTDEGQRTSGQQCPAPPPAPPAMFPPQPAAAQFPAQGQ